MTKRPKMCPTPGCVSAQWHTGACVDSDLQVLRPAPGTAEGVKIDYPVSKRTDRIQEQLRGFASPVDTSKPHNYLIVFDSEHRSHYLDRYAPGSVTLCRIGAALAEMEHDPRGYLGGVDCYLCPEILAERVTAQPEEAHDGR